MSRNIRHVPTGWKHTFNNLLYSEFFQVYVAKNTPANHRPLAMTLTAVDQRLQSHIHTLL